MIRSCAKRFALVSMSLFLGSTFGCGGGGDDLPREAVDGVVTFDGSPLARGSIQFRPETSGPGPSVIAGAVIEGGRFSIARADGLLPGRYKVMIFSGGDETPPEDVGGTAPRPVQEIIPARYNAQTTLSAEIKADGSNTLVFDLAR